jgi:Fe-S-cluster containining protein
MEHPQEPPGAYKAVMGSDPGARCLAVHAGYRCRHSGACCTAGWAIPIEGPAFEALQVHFGNNRDWYRTGEPLPDGAAAILGVQPDGACVFLDRSGGRLCRVHRDVGPQRLPTACRQFPRVVLRDARGTSISLSHYCPTAAAMIVASDGPADLAIVGAPASIALDDGAEGLDAREALPPLLAPGVLMDVASYDVWERRALAWLGGGAASASAAVAAIDRASRRLQRWRPGPEPLLDAVEREFAVAPADEGEEDLTADVARVAVADASVPIDIRRPPPDPDIARHWARVAPWWPSVDRQVRTYLAARLFGNWIAYHGQGVHAIVGYLRVCLSVLKLEAARHHAVALPADAASTPWQTVTEAIRSADLLLVHLSDPKALARLLA